MRTKENGSYTKQMEKRRLIMSKSVISCQFSTKKLFTLKLIIHI
jgi:hypothetical protein